MFLWRTISSLWPWYTSKSFTENPDIHIEGQEEAREGEDIKIKGKVEFHPSLKYIKWQKLKRGVENIDINIHSEKYTGSSNEIGNPILCINSVDAEDESEYMLEVRKGDIKVYSNSLFLKVTNKKVSRKPEIEITCNRKEGQYVFGENVSINVTKITKRLKVLSLTWQKETKEGTETIDTTIPKYRESSTSIHHPQLHINRLTSHDNASFFLLAAFINGETESNKVHVKVQGERPSVSLTKVTGNATSGDTVEYRAFIQSTPAIIRVIWKKGGYVIDQEDPKYEETTSWFIDPVLKINDVNKDDEGVYEIEVTNAVGTTCSSVKLDVHTAAPKIRLLSSPPFEYGRSVTIAEIYSWPEPWMMKMSKFKGEKTEETNNYNLEKTSAGFLKLSMNNLDYTDSGTYQIYVQNAVDGVTEKIIVNVQGMPELFISGPTVVSPLSTAKYLTLCNAIGDKYALWQKITNESTDINFDHKKYCSSADSLFQKCEIINMTEDDEAAYQLLAGSMKSNRIHTKVDVSGKFATEGETNCLRFFKLQSVCAEAMRKGFDDLPPKNFQKKLQKFEKHIAKKPNSIPYDTKNPPASSKELDITSMYMIVRNMEKQSSKNWNKKRSANDNELKDDFEKIIQYRNKLCHLPACEMDTPTFNESTLSLIEVIRRLCSNVSHHMQDVCKILNMVCCAGSDVTNLERDLNCLRKENSRLEKFLHQEKKNRREMETEKEPVGFHKHHTSNIVLLHNDTMARRIKDWYSICFTDRPIKMNETLFVRAAEFSSKWCSSLRCGLTNTNPCQIQFNNTDITESDVFVDQCCHSLNLNDIFCLSIDETLNETCEFSVSINSHECFRDQIHSVSIRQPIWFVFGLCGRVTAIEIRNNSNEKSENTLNVCEFSFTNQC